MSIAGCLSASVCVGVGQPASIVKSFKLDPCRVSPIARLACPPPLPSIACGVGQPAIRATSFSGGPLPPRSCTPARSAPFQSRAWGVGHPVEAVADVGRADARSRERLRPKGVTQSLQVKKYKVDPRVCVSTRNLFAKNKSRAALLDEVVEVGPQVPLVSKPRSFACRAERLARAGSRPHGRVVWHAGAAQGIAPDPDACKEVALSVSHKVGWPYILDAPFVHVARRDVAGGDQVAQPCRGLRVDLVVVGADHARLRASLADSRPAKGCAVYSL